MKAYTRCVRAYALHVLTQPAAEQQEAETLRKDQDAHRQELLEGVSNFADRIEKLAREMMASNEIPDESTLEAENDVNLDNSFSLGASPTSEVRQDDAEALVEQSMAQQVIRRATGEIFREVVQHDDDTAALPYQVVARTFLEILASNVMSGHATQWRDANKTCPYCKDDPTTTEKQQEHEYYSAANLRDHICLMVIPMTPTVVE